MTTEKGERPPAQMPPAPQTARQTGPALPRRSLKTAKLANPNNGINKYPSSPRSISTDPLNALLRLHGRPIELVVYQCSYSLKGMGELISRWASRLDAFSGYPVQT